ncbi:MAG TPA: flagellar motor protein MotB [Candidatus Acidoferrales bacterium]|jgi:chemotaxis protein MotB|nr:flagellar motor protein MotB [Candidatus Acidoferrales bacterium]
MSRKKRHEEHANHERWLVSYADFITLLFAFFVVLYSSSQVDKRKVGKLSLAIQVAFQQMGVFESSNTKMPLSTTEAMPFQDAQVIENVVRTDDLRRIVQPGQGVMSNALSGEMTGIQSEIEKALSPEIRAHVVVLKEQREGLVISLREIGFFDSGSAALRESSEDAIGRLASILSERSEMLRIEGHTDNVPIHNSQFQSNWELSTERATELIKVFVTRYHFAPDRLAAAGYAEFHPVDTNSTGEGRAHNRRVDIVVLKSNIEFLTAGPGAAQPSVAKPTVQIEVPRIVERPNE